MSTPKDTVGPTEKKKNYPGKKRKPGTKDYALILSNLIKYRNELMLTNDPDQIINSILKISVKAQELGYSTTSLKIKSLVKKKINTSFKLREDRYSKLEEKRHQVLELCVDIWNDGKEKHKLYREK